MAASSNGTCHSLPASHPVKSHKALPLHEKVDLLNRIKELPPGTTNVKICEMFGIPKSTLSRIIKSEAKIRESFRYCKYFKRYTPCKDPDVDEMLRDWFYAARARGMTVTKSLLKVKADELAQKLGRTEFSASDGWLSRWQVRHNVSFKRGHETLKMDLPSAQDWFTKVLPELIEGYGPERVYHATETGLFYRAAPDTSFTFSCERSESGKAMEQVTVFLCSNMTGQDKRKLLLIGENPSPASFRGLDINGLPVTYRATRGAAMTATVFDEWLGEWDARLRAEDCRVLVLVQACSAHPPVTTLCNIRLEFLPPCVGTVAHPLHQGVVKKLKTLYRIEILRLVQSYEEYSLMHQGSAGPVDVSSKITLLDAVQFLAKSWRAVGESLIMAGFVKAGFEFPAEKERHTLYLESSADKLQYSLAMLGLPKMENWEEYNSIDDALQCVEESNPDEDLVEAVVAAKKRQLLEACAKVCPELTPDPDNGKRVTEGTRNNGLADGCDFDSFQGVEEITTTEDTTVSDSAWEEPVPMVTNIDAKQSLATLQLFCTQRGLSESICGLLDKLQDELNAFCYQEKEGECRL